MHIELKEGVKSLDEKHDHFNTGYREIFLAKPQEFRYALDCTEFARFDRIPSNYLDYSKPLVSTLMTLRTRSTLSPRKN